MAPATSSAFPPTQRSPTRLSTSPKPPSQLATSPNAESHVGPRRSGVGATIAEGGRAGEGGRAKEAFGSTPIHHLPTEVLSHVFANLPPTSLADAQLVCREWRDVIADEASWRNAFETYYGILSSGLSLGRRLAPTTWRSEYISRVHLLTRWSKSRTPSLTHSPHIGALTTLHLSLPLSSTSTPTSLVSLSLPSSRASKSDPFTGKVAKLSLGATPLDNLLQPIGLPLMSATAVGVAPDGGRIVWGMQDGSFRVVNNANPVSAAARAWAGVEEGTRVMRGHAERVGALGFAGTRGEWFASVGDEGGVGVWRLEGPSLRRDAPVGARVWEGNVPVRLEVRGAVGAKGCAIAFDAGVGGKGGRRAAIAVGMSSGEVHVWRGIGIDGEEGEEEYSRLEGRGTEAVDKLVWDPTADGGASLLVHQAKSPSFLRYTFPPMPSTSPPIPTLFGHKPDYIGVLTAFAVDFDDPPQSPLVPTKPDAKISFTSHTPSSTAIPPTLSTSPSFASLASTLSDDPPPPSSPDAPEAFHGVNAFGRRKYVVAGDAQGRVFIWDWEAEATAGLVEPRKMIQGFGSRVTALEISEVAVFVGGLDGALRCYDTLTSTLLRTFKDRLASRLPARMLAAGLLDASDEDRWKVSVIKANRESVVAAIGGSVLAWRIAAPEVKKRKTKGNGKMSARAERFRSDYALREEVRESLSSLSTESTDRHSQLGQERRLAHDYGLPPSLNNMTEDEAVAFAMMLSVDEEEARWFSGSGQTSANTSPAFRPVHDELADMEGLSLDSDAPPVASSSRAFGNRRGASEEQGDDSGAADDEHARSPSHGSYSRSLSVPSSPFLRGSSLSGSTPSPSSRSTSHTWRPASQHSSPSFPTYEPYSYASTHSHTKVQLSPRLGPTYGSLAVPNDPIPDMSEELWPLAQPSSSSPPPFARTASPSTPSPAPSTPVRRGWNDIARSASASPSGANSPGVASPASLLTSRLRATEQPGVERRDLASREEEELRFAIELSLAEEASRLEQ